MTVYYNSKVIKINICYLCFFKKKKKNLLSLSLSLSTEMMKPLNQRNPPQEPPNNPQPDEVEGKDMFYMIYYWIS